MDKNSIIRYKTSFDDIAQYIEGDNGEQVEVWFARDLMPVLGYARWENFQSAIGRAIDSCKSQNISMDTIFVRSRKWYPLAVVLSAKSGGKIGTVGIYVEPVETDLSYSV